MSEHKFEPFDRVLGYGNHTGIWHADFYSHRSGDGYHVCVGEVYTDCIPYTPETACLIGTSDHYAPPKPPHEYKWGDRVIVDCFAGKNTRAIYLGLATNSDIFYVIEYDNLVRQTDQGKIIRPLEPSHD